MVELWTQFLNNCILIKYLIIYFVVLIYFLNKKYCYFLYIINYILLEKL
jgi:hypothetical protein